MSESIYVRNIHSGQLGRVDGFGTLTVVCLWAALGLTVAALFVHLGFGGEITAALSAG